MRTNDLGEDGQVLIEVPLVMVLILIPFMSGIGIWGTQEYRRAQCAYQSFNAARSQLIRTHLNVEQTFHCVGASEKIKLLTLENLDATHGAGLSISDWEQAATQLWEGLSSFSPSLSGQDSP